MHNAERSMSSQQHQQRIHACTNVTSWWLSRMTDDYGKRHKARLCLVKATPRDKPCICYGRIPVGRTIPNRYPPQLSTCRFRIGKRTEATRMSDKQRQAVIHLAHANTNNSICTSITHKESTATDGYPVDTLLHKLAKDFKQVFRFAASAHFGESGQTSLFLSLADCCASDVRSAHSYCQLD